MYIIYMCLICFVCRFMSSLFLGERFVFIKKKNIRMRFLKI